MIPQRLTFARKLLLLAVGFGVVSAPRIRARSDLKFDVATIKPSEPGQQSSYFRRVPGKGLNAGNVPLKNVIVFAYDVRDFQISGGPGWISSDRFDIVAKPEHFEGPADRTQMSGEQHRTSLARMRARVRALLSERFQLAIHKDTKEFPIYALVLAKAGRSCRRRKATVCR